MAPRKERPELPPILTDAEFRRGLSKPAQGYLFFGEEDYLKLHALEAARQAISPDPSFAAFNEIRMDALDYTPARLLDALVPLPMMQERKLVSLSGFNLTSLRASDVDRFCETVELLAEHPHNCLIVTVPNEGLDTGNLPKKPSELFLRLTEVLTPVRFNRVPPAKLAGWVIKHFNHGGVSASPAVASFLIDYCGRDMFTLAAEAEKLCCYVLAHGRTEVTEADVREVACAGMEYDAFALGNAIMEGRRADALSALAVLRHRRADPILLLGEIIRTWSEMLTVRLLTAEGKSPEEIFALTKIHTYRVGLYRKAGAVIDDARLRRAIALCAEADARLKQSPQGYAALERLICAL